MATTKHIGKGMKFGVNKFDIFPKEEMYIENIGEKKGREIMKEYNLKVPEEIMIDKETDVALMSDKKDGIKAVFLLLPKDGTYVQSYRLNEKVVSGRIHNAFIANLYC